MPAGCGITLSVSPIKQSVLVPVGYIIDFGYLNIFIMKGDYKIINSFCCFCVKYYDCEIFTIHIHQKVLKTFAYEEIN